MGHFETKSDAYRCASIGLILLQELTFWRSTSKVGAGGSCAFHASLIVVQFGAITLSASPVSRLGDVDDERRQAKRNSLAEKLTVETKALADLKIEKASDLVSK